MQTLMAFFESDTDIDLQTEPPHPQSAQDTLPLTGKTFVITGSLSMERDEMKAWIESMGGKVSGAVSAKTHYVLYDLGPNGYNSDYGDYPYTAGTGASPCASVCGVLPAL